MAVGGKLRHARSAGPVVEKLVIGDWATGRSEHNWRSYNVPFSVMQGQLAESWETPDNTTIIVKVRAGVYWHDKPPMNGRELTASDIEFNYHRLLGLGSGFSEPTPFSWTLPAVTSVTATDKSTLVFELTRPDLFGCARHSTRGIRGSTLRRSSSNTAT